MRYDIPRARTFSPDMNSPASRFFTRFRFVTWMTALLLCGAGQVSQAALIDITDNRADFGGDDFIDLAPLAGPHSPLLPFLNGPFLADGLTQFGFSLTSAGGIGADFVVTMYGDGSIQSPPNPPGPSAGALVGAFDPVSNSSVGGGALSLDGEPFAVFRGAVTREAPFIDVSVTFDQPLYGVGTNVSLSGLSTGGVTARRSTGSIPGAVVTRDASLSVDRYAGFVTDAAVVSILRVFSGSSSPFGGNRSTILSFNRIDLLTVAPNTEAPYGPGLDPGNGNMTAVPEPSSLCLLGAVAGGAWLRRRRR